jgi:hypothetical protein
VPRRAPRGPSGTARRAGQSSHLGRPALQISRPSLIMPTCIGVLSSSGTSSSSNRCARSAVVFGTRPRRVATRCTWVSTGIVSAPEREGHHDRGGLRAHSGERREVLGDLLVRARTQARQVVAALPQMDLDAGSPGSGRPSCWRAPRT